MRLRIGAAIVALAVIAMAAIGYSAGWHRLAASTVFDRGEAAGETLEDLAQHVRVEASATGQIEIAAIFSQAGHWRLVNHLGELFTASGPQELARALATLSPNAEKPGQRLHVLLASNTVFEHAQALRELPSDAAISILVEGRRFEVVRPDEEGAGAQVLAGPGIHIDARERAVFREILHQLERPLSRAKVRLVAIEPGGATGLTRAPIVEPGARHGRPDVVDPSHLGQALGDIGGQIAIVSGRLEGSKLIYKPGSGPTGEIEMEALKTSVRSSDTSLVLLDASSARQPGTRNWLWQRIALSSMEKAMGGATLGEFLRALAGEPKTLVVRAMAPSEGRIDLMLEPLVESPPAPVAKLTQVVSGTWSNIVSETAGSVSVRALRASMLTVARQNEIDRRIVPGIPYAVQIGYLVAMGAGWLAFPIGNAWWLRIWPREVEADYNGRAGFLLARLTRALALVLIFLPAAGLPALFVRLTRMVKCAAA